MLTLILKPNIVREIQDSPSLFGNVAKVLGVKPSTLPQILSANKPRLTQAAVMREIRNHTGFKKDSELLIEVLIR